MKESDWEGAVLRGKTSLRTPSRFVILKLTPRRSALCLESPVFADPSMKCLCFRKAAARAAAPDHLCWVFEWAFSLTFCLVALPRSFEDNSYSALRISSGKSFVGIWQPEATLFPLAKPARPLQSPRTLKPKGQTGKPAALNSCFMLLIWCALRPPRLGASSLRRGR